MRRPANSQMPLLSTGALRSQDQPRTLQALSGNAKRPHLPPTEYSRGNSPAEHLACSGAMSSHDCCGGWRARAPTLSQVDNPWVDLPSQAPFVLPVDAPYVAAWNELHGEHEDFQICLDYPPEPFLGRHDAPVAVLSANPGLGPEDSGTWASRDVVDTALDSVTSAEGTSFLWLRDKLAWTAGANWWRPRTAAGGALP
jgi:hypothetical protein